MALLIFNHSFIILSEIPTNTRPTGLAGGWGTGRHLTGDFFAPVSLSFLAVFIFFVFIRRL